MNLLKKIEIDKKISMKIYKYSSNALGFETLKI